MVADWGCRGNEGCLEGRVLSIQQIKPTKRKKQIALQITLTEFALFGEDKIIRTWKWSHGIQSSIFAYIEERYMEGAI